MFDARFPGMVEHEMARIHAPTTFHAQHTSCWLRPESRGQTVDFEDDDATLDKGAEMARIVKELKDSGLQPVSLRELRQTFGAEREGWRGAFETELSSFDTHSCFRRADPEEKVEIYRPGSGWEVLPAKVVAGLKPPKDDVRKKKARVVVCGNHQSTQGDLGYRLDTDQCDATSVRLLLRWAAARKLSIGSVDVKTAFLNAPLPDTMKIAVVPPKILFDWGFITDPSERWILKQALYGLRVSPRLWQETRDQELSKLRWKGPDGTQRALVVSTVGPAVWYIVRPQADNEVVGILGTYVDDLLCACELPEIEACFAAISKVWEVSEPDFVKYGSGNSLKFCGLEIRDLKGQGYFIHQRAFTEELLKQYGMEKTRGTPLPGDRDGPGNQHKTVPVNKVPVTKARIAKAMGRMSGDAADDVPT